MAKHICGALDWGGPVFETTAPPRSVRDRVGTATLFVGAGFLALWIGVFTIATAMILPLWNAGDVIAVAATSLKAAAPLLAIGLFGTIFTMGAYGLSRNVRSER